MLNNNLIRPSDSPYSAPILFAKTKDGCLRLYVDYRASNKNTIVDSYPLPRIDELLSRLQGAKYFSRLDLWDGYFHVPIGRSYDCIGRSYDCILLLVRHLRGLSDAIRAYERTWDLLAYYELDIF